MAHVKYMASNWLYCPKCALLSAGPLPRTWTCPHCGYEECKEIDASYGITSAKREEFLKKQESGEISEEEFFHEWEDFCQPFIDEVIRQNPAFDPDVYRTTSVYEEETRRLLGQYPSMPPVVRCPWCGSYDTKKIRRKLFSRQDKSLKYHCENCQKEF
ncbi:MAG: transposase [Clostridiales bacterium]|nr:transposase [Clostridiales bacterium]